jgi:DNA-binding transcriptional LysR family regulator
MLDDLKAFVAVVDHNSLTRAAAVLSLTQSAVSRRIQHLEELLGADLFDRASKPPKATALAHRIYEQAVPLLRGAGHLLEIAREDAAPSGIFRLGFTQVIADVVLVDTITRMTEAFPALDIQLRTTWSPELQQQIGLGALDAATLMLPSGTTLPEDISGMRIATLDIVVVQSKPKPSVDRRTAIKALASRDWILNPMGCGYRAALERAMENHGRNLRLVVDTYDTEKQLRLVAAGLGLGLVPRTVLRRSTHYKDLSIVDVEDFSLSLDIWLVHPRQLGNLKRAAEVLGQTVAEGFSTFAKPLARKSPANKAPR